MRREGQRKEGREKGREEGREEAREKEGGGGKERMEGEGIEGAYNTLQLMFQIHRLFKPVFQDQSSLSIQCTFIHSSIVSVQRWCIHVQGVTGLPTRCH